LFVGWAVIYPLVITICWYIFIVITRRYRE
jgi:hypothetical protein